MSRPRRAEPATPERTPRSSPSLRGVGAAANLLRRGSRRLPTSTQSRPRRSCVDPLVFHLKISWRRDGQPPGCGGLMKVFGNWRAKSKPEPPSREERVRRDAYFNSLLRRKNSLFLGLFSLFIRVGKCSRSDCGTAVSGSEIVSRTPKIANFPVKFPVSREFAWRRVRSALHRQPGSAGIAEVTS